MSKTVKKVNTDTPWDASGIRIDRWLNMENGDDGEPLIYPSYADRSVQIKGNFGNGGTIIMEGSNEKDSPTWFGLTNPQGDPVSFTAEGIMQIVEAVYQIRPRVTAGNSATDLSVALLSRLNP